MQYDQSNMGHGRRHRFLVLVLVLACPWTALADPSSESVKVARKRFLEGVAAADARNYEGARVAFQQAYALKPHPSVLRNLGQAELKTGHYLDAARHLATFIRDTTFGSPGERESAKKALAEAETKVGRLVLEVDVAGAEISVDGEIAGRSPMGADPVYVEPGARVVRVQRDGYDLYEQTQVFERDRTIQLRVALRPAGPLPTEAASVSRVSPALVDPTMTMPSTNRAHSAGPSPFPRSADEGSRSSARTAVLISGSGVTVVALGIGVVSWLKGVSYDDDAAAEAAAISRDQGQNACAPGASVSRPCLKLAETLDRRSTANRVAQGAFFTAGAFGVATIATYFLWPDLRKSGVAGVSFAPATLGQGFSLGVNGAF